MDTTIHLNVADIPPEVGESFGRVTLAGFKKFIAQPGNREKLEAQTAARKAQDNGMRTVGIYVKGPGSGREAAMRAISAIGFKVAFIRDVTPIPHNGCRPPKRRRV